jgi:hypothetical protein
MSRAEEKKMLTCFSYHGALFALSFLKKSRKVMLASLREAVRGIRPRLVPDAWTLLPDSAPSRETFSVWKLIASNTTILELYQPLYSPYLVQCDFWLFPKRESALKSHRFQTLLIFRDMRVYGDHP